MTRANFCTRPSRRTRCFGFARTKPNLASPPPSAPPSNRHLLIREGHLLMLASRLLPRELGYLITLPRSSTTRISPSSQLSLLRRASFIPPRSFRPPLLASTASLWRRGLHVTPPRSGLPFVVPLLAVFKVSSRANGEKQRKINPELTTICCPPCLVVRPAPLSESSLPSYESLPRSCTPSQALFDIKFSRKLTTSPPIYLRRRSLFSPASSSRSSSPNISECTIPRPKTTSLAHPRFPGRSGASYGKKQPTAVGNEATSLSSSLLTFWRV
jgi:hypothetical protein